VYYKFWSVWLHLSIYQYTSSPYFVLVLEPSSRTLSGTVILVYHSSFCSFHKISSYNTVGSYFRLVQSLYILCYITCFVKKYYYNIFWEIIYLQSSTAAHSCPFKPDARPTSSNAGLLKAPFSYPQCWMKFTVFIFLFWWQRTAESWSQSCDRNL
jgi:hypothetical protein